MTKEGFREYLQEKAILAKRSFPWVAGSSVFLLATAIWRVWTTETFPLDAIVIAVICVVFTIWAINLWAAISPDFQKADELIDRINRQKAQNKQRKKELDKVNPS